tara:strand:- start:1952 stop:2779 length:828 start_codon:yes stop_codon:yes gene_type:complete
MTAVNLRNLLIQANKDKYALAGLVVLGWEDAIAYTKAADETKIPIILQAGPSCRNHTNISVLGKMFRFLAEQTKTKICCHLDHGYTIDQCKEAMDNGFTSVMFDGSRLPLKKNIKISKSIVKIAKKYNVSVEGEVGIVGYYKNKVSLGTNLKDAINYSKNSGVDAMAISVGNTHLQLNKIANIDINKILLIEQNTNIPLVLHGSSGIPYILRKKIARKTNVAKFNIGTELRMTFGQSVRKTLSKNKKIYDRLEILKPSINILKRKTIKIIKNIGP